MRSQLRAAAVLLAVYALARLALSFSFSAPVFGWRPADMASISLNYARNGFHFLYPQVAWGGGGPGYVEMEFPIVPFLTGILLEIFRFDDRVFLIIPNLCGFGIVWLTYRLGVFLFDDDLVAVAAGIMAAVSPPLILLTTTGLWADPPMVLFASLGIYLAARWAQGAGARELWIAVACLSLGILLKLTALYVGIPMLYLVVKRYGARWWRQKTTWLAALAILVPPALWYYHAYRLAAVYHNSFGILSAGSTKFGSLRVMTSWEFYADALKRVALYHFTPLGSVALACGLAVTFRRRASRILLVWLSAIVLSGLVAANGVRYGHFAYLLPVLPVGSIYVGVGFRWLLDQLRRAKVEAGRRRGLPLEATAVAAACVLFAASTAWADRRFETHDLHNEMLVWTERKTTGLLVREVTRPGSRIILLDTENNTRTPGSAMVPPDVYYFGDRQGWYLAVDWASEEKIRSLHESGADYLVVSGESVSALEVGRRDLYAALSNDFRVVSDSQEGVIFDLDAAPSRIRSKTH